MFVRLTISDIKAQQTSDSQDPVTGLFDHTDEDYFLVSGASVTDGGISYRVTAPHDDHFDISDGQTLHNFVLWEGFVGVHAGAFLTVVLRDRKNTSWDAILNFTETAGLAAAAILLEDPSLGQAAVTKLGDSATQLVHNLQGDNDKTLGAFSIRLTTQDGTKLQTTWQNLDFTALLDQPVDPSVHFHMTGSNSTYELTVGTQTLELPMIVNIHSGKCLDVPGFSLNDVQIQQFTVNGGPNQRWYLKLLGIVLDPTARVRMQPGVDLQLVGGGHVPGLGGNLLGLPYYAIVNSFSGKALDVRGGTTDDHAAIQQFHAHYGPDQQFAFVGISGQNGFLIVNVNSDKCLDVENAAVSDGALIQQLIVNGQDNERWFIQQSVN